MLNNLLLRKNNFALFLTFLLALLSLLLPRPSRGAEMPTFERLQPVTSYIKGAIDVATDQADNLYVADSAKDSVIIFDEFGQYSAVLQGLSFPLCVAVNSTGNIYVGNKKTANVEVYDSGYSFLRKLGSGDGEFSQPNDIAISAAGQIYVTDWGADVVKVYGSDGTYSTSFGSSGNGDGEFHRPVSIAIDEIAQELIVLDHQLLLADDVWIDGARLQVFDMNGVFKRAITKMELPAIKAQDLYKPQRVTVDGQSRLYVTDTRRNVVQVYDSTDFTYLGAVYDLDDPMRIPVGITLGENDVLYIASRGSSYVEVYQLGEIVPASSSSSSLDSFGTGPSTLSHTTIPQLSVAPTPSALTFTSTDGSIPAGQKLTITNIGPGKMTWTASAFPSWIRLDNISGTAPDSVEVTVDITSLAAGEHLGSVTITGDRALSSPTHVGVTLNIVQTGSGEGDGPLEDGQQPPDNGETKFPWILFKHLLERR